MDVDDLNPHKPRYPPLEPPPDGYYWYGVYPDHELLPIEEWEVKMRTRIKEHFAKRKEPHGISSNANCCP